MKSPREKGGRRENRGPRMSQMRGSRAEEEPEKGPGLEESQ